MNNDLIYKRIGSIIRDRRKILKLTQDALSERLEISRASLANIETGRQNFPVHQLYNIARELELTPTDLLPVFVSAPQKGKPTKIPLPSDLNPEQRQQIVALLEDVQFTTPEDREVVNAKQTKARS